MGEFGNLHLEYEQFSMKTIEITNESRREDRGGSIVMNFDYVLTDDLGRKKAGSGSLAVARSTPNNKEQDAILWRQVEQDIARRIGFSTFTFIPPKQRQTLSIGRA